MRFRITLQLIVSAKGNIIPINYQYELSSWIYRTIQEGDSAFGDWLHEKGYMFNGKSFKLFTFSRLQIPKKQFQIKDDRLYLHGVDICFYVSFLLENSAEPFITGLFRNQQLILGDRISQTKFLVRTIERLPDPEFCETMSLHLLSPLVVNKVDGKHGEFLRPDHNEFENLFFQNLVRKYLSSVQDLPGLGDLEGLKNDPATIMKIEVLTEPMSKLVLIKAGTEQETKIRGYMFDFKITAPVPLIRTGYFAGFGEKNSLGFGCGEII